MAEGARSSLQRRLFGWLMLPLVLALPLLGAALYEQVQSSAQSWLDEGLEDTALTLAGQIDTRGGEPRIDISATMDRALRFDRQDDVFYLVLGPRGEVLQGDAGLVELQPRPGVQGLGNTVYSDVKLRGRDLRLAQLGHDCGIGICQVLVAETLHKRDALQRQIGSLVAINGAGLAVLLALAGWWAIRQGLTPLTGLIATCTGSRRWLRACRANSCRCRRPSTASSSAWLARPRRNANSSPMRPISCARR